MQKFGVGLLFGIICCLGIAPAAHAKKSKRLVKLERVEVRPKAKKAQKKQKLTQGRRFDLRLYGPAASSRCEVFVSIDGAKGQLVGTRRISPHGTVVALPKAFQVPRRAEGKDNWKITVTLARLSKAKPKAKARSWVCEGPDNHATAVVPYPAKRAERKTRKRRPRKPRKARKW